MPTEQGFRVDPASPAGRALALPARAWPRRVSILGSTGTVGEGALHVLRAHPGKFVVDTLAAGTRMRALAAQVKEFAPLHVVVRGEAERAELLALTDLEPGAIALGARGLAEASARPVDVVLNAVGGAAGLPATMGAVEAGRVIALANKESLVLAGDLVDRRARVTGACVVPVDSEHAGLFQCLAGAGSAAAFARLVLTASGGPLRTRADWADATPEEVLAHPVWAMGPRITVDSALLLNKGFEVLEARALFGVPLQAIDVVIHPQAIVHALVEMIDHSTLAQLSLPDMRLPVQLALAWPDRIAAPIPALDFARAGRLDFEPLRPGRFPAFDLARRAAEQGGIAPAVLNGADEVLVATFLAGRLRLGDVPLLLAECLAAVPSGPADTLAAIDAADLAAREAARDALGRRGLSAPAAAHAGGSGH
jgi:1-deoxy-D-xylulose-5-phosphate reductoisomerase